MSREKGKQKWGVGKRTELLKDKIERQIAIRVGFPENDLLMEERNFLPNGIEIHLYLPIRNHVLTRWRTHPERYLAMTEAAKHIQTRYADLVGVAWKFLDHFGYINFGVSPSLCDRMQSQTDKKGSVIIIGAGLAGLAAARQLRMKGHRVIVLEATNKIGGRVCTHLWKVGDEEAIVDFGGSIVGGLDGNPLAILACQKNIPLHRIAEKSSLHSSEGSIIPEHVDAKCETFYNELLDKCGRFRQLLGKSADHISLEDALKVAWDKSSQLCTEDEKRLINWHFANLEFANASKLSQISLGGWDQDDPYGFRGDHAFVAGGNGQLINALADGIDILFNQIVITVKCSVAGVEVTTEKAIHKADAVLLTVPLGVLKRETIFFDPPLSQRKRGAISRLGFGILNKIVFWFPTCFWSEKGDSFGFVNHEEDARGLGFLFYSNEYISGGHVLIALVAGSAAEAIEVQEDKDLLVAKVIEALHAIFDDESSSPMSSPKVPHPTQVHCTSWGSFPYAFGSYSSVHVGSAGGDDYDILAENAGERLFFAGEATCRKYPATMHGAFLSGQREAAYITAALMKKNGCD